MVEFEEAAVKDEVLTLMKPAPKPEPADNVLVKTVPEIEVPTIKKKVDSNMRDVPHAKHFVLTKQETMEAYHDELRLNVSETIVEEPSRLDQVSAALYANDEEIKYELPQLADTTTKGERTSPVVQQEPSIHVHRFSVFTKQDTIEVSHREVYLDVAETVFEDDVRSETVPETEAANIEEEKMETKIYDEPLVKRSSLTKQETMEAYQDETKVTVGETTVEELPELDQVSAAAYVKDEELTYEHEQLVAFTAQEELEESPVLQKEPMIEIRQDELSFNIDDTFVELQGAAHETDSAILYVVEIEKPDISVSASAEPTPVEARRDEITIDTAAGIDEESVAETEVSVAEKTTVIRDVAYPALAVESAPHEIQIDTEIATKTAVSEEAVYVEIVPKTKVVAIPDEIRETKIHDTAQATMEAYHSEVKLTESESILEEPSEFEEVSEAAYVKDEVIKYEPGQVAGATTEKERESPTLQQEPITEICQVEHSLDIGDSFVELSAPKEEGESAPVPANEVEKPTEATYVVEVERDELHADTVHELTEEQMPVLAETTNDVDVDSFVELPQPREVPTAVTVEIQEPFVAINEEPPALTAQETVDFDHDEIRLTRGEAILEAASEFEEVSDTAYRQDAEMEFEHAELDVATAEGMPEQEQRSTEVGQDELSFNIADSYVELSASEEETENALVLVGDVEKPAEAAYVVEVQRDELNADTVHELTEEHMPVLAETRKDLDVDPFIELSQSPEVPSAVTVEIQEPFVAINEEPPALTAQKTVDVDHDEIKLTSGEAMLETASEFEEVSDTAYRQDAEIEFEPAERDVAAAEGMLKQELTTEVGQDEFSFNITDSYIELSASVEIQETVEIGMPEEETAVNTYADELVTVIDISQQDAEIKLATLPSVTLENQELEEWQVDQTTAAFTELAEEITAADTKAEEEYGLNVEEEESFGVRKIVSTRHKDIADVVECPTTSTVVKASEVIADETMEEVANTTSYVTFEQVDLYQKLALEEEEEQVKEIEIVTGLEAKDLTAQEFPEAQNVVEPGVEKHETEQIDETVESTVSITTVTSYVEKQLEPITSVLESADEVFEETVDSAETEWESRYEGMSHQLEAEEEMEQSTSDEWFVVEKIKTDSEKHDEEDYGFSVEEEESFGYGFEITTTGHRRTKLVRSVGEDGEIIETSVETDRDEEDEDDESDVAISRGSSVSDFGELGMEVAGITVYTSTVEGEPNVETELNEYEDVLPDGTIVRRRVLSTRCRQTVTKRVVLEGLDDDDSPFDDVGPAALSPVGSFSADDTCRLVTRYADRSVTDPELSTEVQQSEDTLADGTRLQKRTITRHSQQLTTDRLVVAGTRLFVEGGASDEDEVFDNLRSIGSPTPSAGMYDCCSDSLKQFYT